MARVCRGAFLGLYPTWDAAAGWHPLQPLPSAAAPALPEELWCRRLPHSAAAMVGGAGADPAKAAAPSMWSGSETAGYAQKYALDGLQDSPEERSAKRRAREEGGEVLGPMQVRGSSEGGKRSC